MWATAGATTHDWWAWDGIAIQLRVIYVDEDTGVRSLIELCAHNAAAEAIGAAPRDFNVHALRVVLSATLIIGSVESNGLVAEDVFAWSDG